MFSLRRRRAISLADFAARQAFARRRAAADTAGRERERAHGICLSPEELVRITGCRQPHAQLAELLRYGFFRARRHQGGPVILEREHYVSVCRGTYGLGAGDDARPRPMTRSQREALGLVPKVKPPALRTPRGKSK